MARHADRSPEIGRIVTRAFDTIGSDPLPAFGSALLLGALPQTVLAFAGDEGARSGDPGLWFFASSGTAALLSLVSAAVTQGALVRVAIDHAEGDRATLPQALGAGLRAAVPLIGLGLLTAFGIVLGLALMFVPGLMLWVAWSVAAPALAAERCGVFRAIGRSRALTHGARWRIFAMQLAVLVLYWLIGGVFDVGTTAVFGVIGDGPGSAWGLAAFRAMGETLTLAVWGTIHASLYIELRDWKDGPASARLADVFA